MSRDTGSLTLLLTPICLPLSMYAVFHGLTRAFGFPLGYLFAFAAYWIGWCTGLPLGLLGRPRVAALWRARLPIRDVGWRQQLALWCPLMFPLYFAFLPRVAAATAAVLAVSLVLGVVTGTAEELLWRGTYLTVFPDRVWLNTWLPSIAFGIWHLCPLAVLPSHYAGGTAAFVAYSVALGLSYAYVARTTGSIWWCAMAHALHDTLGLGGAVYVQWL
jgi:membrane protease YdiL (CAAX protease family)